MTRQSRRIAWTIVSGIVTIALLWMVLRPRPIVVETALAVRGPLSASVVGEGRTRVKDLYVVAAPVDGELERIALEPGDTVRVGATVAHVWPLAPRPLDTRSRAEAIAAVTGARSVVLQAEATQREAATALTHAQTQYQTLRALARDGAAPANDAEHAGHEVESRRQAVDAAAAAVKTAQAELARLEAVVATSRGRDAQPAASIASPSAGRVLQVLRESAGPVTAGTPLLAIGDVSVIEIVSDFLTADALVMRPGDNATISDWGGQGVIAARVRRVDPAAFTKVSALGLEEQRVHVVLDLTGPPPPGLGHDFHVTVGVVVWSSPNALAIPSTALFRMGNDWAVFTVLNNRAHLALVKPSRSDASRTAIDQGITEGQAVIVQPSDLIEDGSRVTRARVMPSR